MKVKFMFTAAIIASSLLTGCATSDLKATVGSGSAVSTSNAKIAARSPKDVKVYYGNAGLPKQYKVIGHVTAPQFNLVGMSYSEESINKELKSQAGSIGGKGVINVKTGMDRTSGDVII